MHLILNELFWKVKNLHLGYDICKMIESGKCDYMQISPFEAIERSTDNKLLILGVASVKQQLSISYFIKKHFNCCGYIQHCYAASVNELVANRVAPPIVVRVLL